MPPGSIGTIGLITQPGEFEKKYFISNPDITFFKSVYRKHTNFSKYLKQVVRPNIQPDAPVHHTIQTGSDDLLSKVYLENKYTFTMDPETAGTGANPVCTIYANLGSNMIDANDDDGLSIDIGGNKRIFKSNGIFQEVKAELENQMSLTVDGAGTATQHYTCAPCLELEGNSISCKNGSHYNYTTLSGGVRGMTLTKDNFDSGKNVIETEYFYTIPEFSFMKDYGLSIPLLSLRNEHITFNVKYQGFNSVFSSASNITSALESNFIQELIQLDTAEKSRFLTSQLTYLTEDIIHAKIDNLHPNISAHFKLCKYLFLVGEPAVGTTTAPHDTHTSRTTPTAVKFTYLNISMDGNSIYPGGTDGVPAEIFTKLNINKYFIGCGRDLGSPSAAAPAAHSLGQLDSIAMIPFSIEPTNFTQPSGCVSTLETSNKIKLDLILKDGGENPDLRIFAINYGILQISDGKAQLQNS